MSIWVINQANSDANPLKSSNLCLFIHVPEHFYNYTIFPY